MANNKDHDHDGWKPIKFSHKCTFLQNGTRVEPDKLRRRDLFTVQDTKGEFKVLQKRLEGKHVVILAERLDDDGFMKVMDRNTGEVYNAYCLVRNSDGTSVIEYGVTHRGYLKWLPAGECSHV